MSSIEGSTGSCALCAASIPTGVGKNRCNECHIKGQYAGKVVWNIVDEAIRSAAQQERVTFMLAGLKALHLEGVARQFPATPIEDRSLLLRINQDAAENLIVDWRFLTSESAIHWRHSTAADVIVFAPSDEEREQIGAGLGPLSRIDEQTVIERTTDWVDMLGESCRPREYLISLLDGLRDSQVFIDLEMWIDFIRAIKAQGFSRPVHTRMQRAAPALGIPLDGIEKLPKLQNSTDVKPAHRFRQAFDTAWYNVSVYAKLLTPGQDPVNIPKVRENLETLRREVSVEDEAANDEAEAAIAAVERLLDDEPNFNFGDWRQSQKEFCERVSWTRFGKRIFSGSRKTTRTGMGKRTLKFIEGNYGDEVSDTDRTLLENLTRNPSNPPKEEEREFFDKWQDKLNHPQARLFKPWLQRIYPKSVSGRDLLSTIEQGVEALLLEGSDALVEMSEPCILVRASQHAKAIFWKNLDKRVQRLFTFEYQLLHRQLGARVKWDIDTCLNGNAEKPSIAKDKRKVDLVLFLIEATDIQKGTLGYKPPSDAPRIKAVWQPGLKSKDQPIGLAFEADVSELAEASATEGGGIFRKQTFASLPGAQDTSVAPLKLADTNTFSDVLQSQTGRTFSRHVRCNDNIVEELRQTILDLKNGGSLDDHAADELRHLIDAFESKYCEAIQTIANKPQDAFASDSVTEQAELFGRLCRACRIHATTGKAQTKIWPLVARIGLIYADGSQRMAIIPAWHPFRLVERKAKIRSLACFVDRVLDSEVAKNADLTIAFAQRRRLVDHWSWPGIAIAGQEPLISVEDRDGYSLLVPARIVGRNKEELEATSVSAAKWFMDSMDQYLEIHPHEKSNLSATIYNLESLTLPREIARLMAKRIHGDPALRCDLVISHQEPDRLQEIYRDQNLRLENENISETAKSFLSRLRVDVRPAQHAQNNGNGSIHDFDLIFLHDAINRKSRPVWIQEHDSAETQFESFDPESKATAKLRLAEADPIDTEIYLTQQFPPCAVAEYQNLLYAMCNEANLEVNKHGALVRRVNYSDSLVSDLINRAHDLAQWVISIDLVPIRHLLEEHDVRIIRDASLPNAERRVVISSKKIDNRLTRRLEQELDHSFKMDHGEASTIAGEVLNDGVQLSGLKVLSAARNENAAREIIGLCVVRIHLKSLLLKNLPAASQIIWLSLDDYRHWFTSGKGKIADMIGILVECLDPGFRVSFLVGEAKFISKVSLGQELSDAGNQVRDTVNHIRRVLIDNKDSISRVAWCRQLAELLIHHGKLTSHIRDQAIRNSFLKNMHTGDIDFRICGESTLCLHDEYEPSILSEHSSEARHLGHTIIPSPKIKAILQAVGKGADPPSVGLRALNWYHASTAPETEKLDPRNGNPLAEPKPVSPPGSSPAATPETQPEISKPSQGFIPATIATVLREIAKSDTGSVSDAEARAWADKTCVHTQRALSHFGMHANFMEPSYRLTHNGVFVTFKGHPTLTIDKVEKRRSEMLTTHGLDVVNVLPGRGIVELFIRREKRAPVPLASTWLGAKWPDRPVGEWTNFILGAREDADGLMYLNLGGQFGGFEEHGPHTLIAGQTGSGKGVLTQNLLLQLIAFNDPSNVELVLVDPKMGVDYGWMKRAPHLRKDIISDMESAKQEFENLVAEMDRRYKLLEEQEVPNFVEYNRRVSNRARLSRLFLVHDELGSWMAQEPDYNKVVLSSVANLGMKARAAGIHLVLITQRADAEAVPSRLRDNMGNKLCLRVQDWRGSQMVLNCAGAEKLLGKGHLACILANEASPPGKKYYLVQVPFAKTDELERLAKSAIDHWRTRRPNGPRPV